MSVHLERARMLLGQDRFDLAEQEAGLALLEQPQESQAHAILAVCHLKREKFESASEHAAEAVRLAPDVPLGHIAAAQVWMERNYLDRAEEAARTAVALDPEDPDWHAMLSSVLFRRKRWADALAEANAGLEIDPEHVDSLNLQASALRQLGQADASRGSLHDALQQNPDDAWTHANLGWTWLHKGDPVQAERHFREALRLDPDLDVAREGVIEAIKAKNPLYRWILHGFLRLARLTTAGQWYFVLGAYFAYRVTINLAQDHPEWGVVLWPLVWAYLAFVLISWFTTPLSNLLLRLHPFGKLALSRDERRASNWVGSALGGGLLLLAIGSFVNSELASVFGLSSLLLAIPLAMAFSCSEPRARRVMVWYTVALVALAAPTLGYCLSSPDTTDAILGGNKNSFFASALISYRFFVWGCFLSVWAVNIAKSVAWKR